MIPVIIGACIRDLSKKLPILDKLSKRKDTHTLHHYILDSFFGEQFNLLSKELQELSANAPAFLIGNPGDWPRWDALKKLKESGKLIENKSKISLILAVLLFGLPFI